ncbi:MAG: DUF1887 family protein [Clostridia bacterium]|nr:DUF1887 family protein [Clostridia bacterium]
MKILIELYDREPIYNYLATSVFDFDRVYFVGDCAAINPKIKNKTEKYARIMGLSCEFVYRNAKSCDFGEIRAEISRIIDKERKNGNACTIDVTGGRDLALVACGTLLDKAEIIYYDRQIGSFRFLSSGKSHKVNLGIPCTALITAAGGTVYETTRSMSFTADEWGIIRRIIRIFFDRRENWTSLVKYLQRVSKKEGQKIGDSLFVDAPISVADGGRRFSFNEAIMRELEEIGAIKSLEITQNRIKFRYISSDFATMLVNEGIWLEMSVYLTARDMPEFFEAQTGVKFVWDVPEKGENISRILASSVPRNEVDAVLSKGVAPVFISCKTRVPTNEDLNELYAIKENFGGELAYAIMATTKYVGKESPTYERAKAMGIGMIDERNFEKGTVAERLLRLTGE